MASLEAKRAIARTERKMKALQQLDAFRGRIVAVMDAIEHKDEFTLAETCHEICEVGTQILKVSTVLRPITLEGGKKRNDRNLCSKFERHVLKNTGRTPGGVRKEGAKPNDAWIEANCDIPKNTSEGWFDQWACKVKSSIDTRLLPQRLRGGPKNWSGRWVVPTKKWLQENDKS